MRLFAWTCRDKHQTPTPKFWCEDFQVSGYVPWLAQAELKEHLNVKLSMTNHLTNSYLQSLGGRTAPTDTIVYWGYTGTMGKKMESATYLQGKTENQTTLTSTC